MNELSTTANDEIDVCRNILRSSCLPIYWFEKNKLTPILHSGTITVIKTSRGLFGITAKHVMDVLRDDTKSKDVGLQIHNAVYDEILDRIVDSSSKLDIAIISLDEALLERAGKITTPLSLPQPNQKINSGDRIMLAGYAGIDRIEKDTNVDFGLATFMGLANTVTEEQITWKLDREHGSIPTRVPDLPPNHDLGGMSGGPLISWDENSSSGLVRGYLLSGIISECQPNLEYVVAKRTNFISEDGKISKA